MRTETCDGCGEPFRIRPNHPSWEVDCWCPSCYCVVAKIWNMQYVAPAAMARAERAEDV